MLAGLLPSLAALGTPWADTYNYHGLLRIIHRDLTSEEFLDRRTAPFSARGPQRLRDVSVRRYVIYDSADITHRLRPHLRV